MDALIKTYSIGTPSEHCSSCIFQISFGLLIGDITPFNIIRYERCTRVALALEHRVKSLFGTINMNSTVPSESSQTHRVYRRSQTWLSPTSRRCVWNPSRVAMSAGIWLCIRECGHQNIVHSFHCPCKRTPTHERVTGPQSIVQVNRPVLWCSLPRRAQD